jgi:hypothetical protein
METKMLNDLVIEIQNEVLDFYNVEVNDEVVKDFISFYYENLEDECYKPFTDDGVPLFDTTEREDFMYHLEDLGLI